MLNGHGTITGTLTNMGSLVPSASLSNGTATPTGILTINGNYTQTAKNSTLAIQINGATAGTQYDQVNVSGQVTLGGTLKLTLGTMLKAGDQFTILKHTGTSLISGTFAGLPEGARLTVNGTTFQISYKGGTGHDVVLTVVGSASSSSAGSQRGSGSIFVSIIVAIIGLLAIAGALVLFLIYRRRSNISLQDTQPMKRI
jgi:hypothetical protein